MSNIYSVDNALYVNNVCYNISDCEYNETAIQIGIVLQRKKRIFVFEKTTIYENNFWE